MRRLLPIVVAMLALGVAPGTASAAVTLTRTVGASGFFTSHTYTLATTDAAQLSAVGNEGTVTIPENGSTFTGTASFTFTADSAIALSGDTTGCTGGGSTSVTCGTGVATITVNINGSTGNDRLAAGIYTPNANQAFTVDMNGGDGVDFLDGGPQSASLDGGPGDDTLVPGGGDDGVAVGGQGSDTARYDEGGRSSGVNVNLAADGPDGGPGDGSESLVGVEGVVGTEFDDAITGDAGPNALRGLAGADRLEGGAGVDTFDGGAGDDLLLPGDGDGGVAVGGEGSDTVSYATERSASVSVSLTATTSQNAGTFTGIENVTGSPFDDQITGDAGPNIVNGGGGSDTLRGLAGADKLDGGDAGDELDGGGDGDTIGGGDGVDFVRYDSRTGGVAVSLDGRPGDGEKGEGDNVRADVENVLGGAGTDILVGSATANLLDGGGGADAINGQGGPDTLRGGDADDKIQARDRARDTVDCGRGTADRVVRDRVDVLTACERRIDRRVAAGVGGRFEVEGAIARVTRLGLARLSPGDRVRVKCRNRADRGIADRKRRSCPLSSRTIAIRRTTRRLDLTGLFRGRSLRPGTVITIRITARDRIGEVTTFTTRRGLSVSRKVTCLAPGETVAVAC